MADKKNFRLSVGSLQGRAVICNILLAIVSIVAIVTLAMGSFMKITLAITLDGEQIGEMADANGSSQEDTAEIMEMIKEFKLPTFEVSFDMKGPMLLAGVFGDGSKQFGDMVANTVDNVIDQMLGMAEQLIGSVMDLAVKKVKDAVSEEIKQQIATEMNMPKEEVTQEMVDKKLEEEYGLVEEQIKDISESINQVAKDLYENGDTSSLEELIKYDDNVDKLFTALVTEEFANEGKDTSPEAVDQEVQQRKDELWTECNNAIDEMRNEDGQIEGESIVIGAMDNYEIKDANGNPVEITSMEDVKLYIMGQITQKVQDSEASKYLDIFIKVFGAMLMVVMAAWAYFLIKIIVKTFSKKNKTVGMFFPRFFGWMPHVFFVGLPMLVIKYADKIIGKFGGDAAAEIEQMLNGLNSMISLKITSLTWVSALCTVVLFAIWIPYYQWRRQLKHAARGR